MHKLWAPDVTYFINISDDLAAHCGIVSFLNSIQNLMF